MTARVSHWAPMRVRPTRHAPLVTRVALFAVLGAFALTAAPSVIARACGLCVEDKVAATFDPSVRERAARIGHVVVFTEVRGPAAGAPPALRDFIVHALAATPGVDSGTIRVSLEPPAAAFACDPSRHTPAALLAAVNPRLATRRLSLTVIKIDDGGRHAAPRSAVASVPSRDRSR